MNRKPQPGEPAGDAASPARRGELPHPLDWAPRAGAVDDVLQRMTAHLGRQRRRRLRAVAGSALALALATVLWIFVQPAGPLDGAGSTSIAMSQPARQVLPDGSIVELKEGARISVDYNDRFRRVALLEGEAHFQVAKNAHQPFVVVAGGFDVSAVGTAFSVQRGHAAIEVLVTEGRVAIEQPAIAAPAATAATSALQPSAPPAPLAPRVAPLALLNAGDRLVVDLPTPAATVAAPKIEIMTAAQMNQRLAWRTPRLQFSGTPLREIIPLINRHSRVQLVIAEPELGHVRLSGTLRADDIDTLLDLLAEGYGISVDRRSETELALRKTR